MKVKDDFSVICEVAIFLIRRIVINIKIKKIQQRIQSITIQHI